MDDLRSWWEVPSIAHFCSLFRSAFDLTDFDIEDLEEGFLQAETDDGSAFLLDLLCRLLNGCYGRKDVTITNYDLYVKDIIKYKWDGTDSPIKEKSEFKALTLRERVELIYAICEYRLDTEDVIEQLKGFEGDSMRVEPLGKDKDGALYWYFYGNRLYMEDPEPKKELTKEEKRARDRERRIESKKKKQEEKRQKKEEKRKLRTLRKVERKKKLEEAKKIEESNTRRSGRLRTRKVEIPESESSDTSSTSEEEEETEESSQDESEKEEKVKKKTGRGRPKKTPAKSRKKETASQKTPPTKKETPAKGTRSSSRKITKQQETPDPKTPQTDISGTRRSARSRKKPEPPPLPSPYNSETEEENDYDIDSGHESAGSLRSETSKVSISTSKKSASAEKRSSRRPTVNVDLKRDLSHTEDDADEEKDGDGCEKEEKVSCKSELDGCEDDDVNEKEKHDDQIDTESCKNIKEKVEAEDFKEDELLVDKGKGDNDEIDEETENKKEEKIVEDGGSGEGKEDESNDKVKFVDESKSMIVSDDNAKSDQEEPKDGKTDLTKTEEIQNMDETYVIKDSENIDDKKDKVTLSADDAANVKTDKKNEIETKEEINTDNENAVSNENSSDETDIKTENSNFEKGTLNVKPDVELEENFNDSNGKGAKRVLRKRNTEEIETKFPDDVKGKNESDADEDIKPRVFSLSGPAVAPKPSTSTTRWHLVCETLDDWINLAEWFKDSQVRCEKSLSKLIREDFLPVLPEIIEAREKEKHRRLLQEQDLRRSNRITMKMREKMEQEKILAEALAEEEKARIKCDEERRLKEEQLKLEDENRQREERRKAREERAMRLSMREERARLLAEGKEIPPEMIYTGSQKCKDDGEDSDDSKCDLKEEEDYETLMKVINAMKYHKDCWPFLEPVTDEQAPGYSDVIKRPMDLSKIEGKVENREYRSTQHFLSDFRLMFNNCKRFNGQDSEFSDCARSMENMLKKYMKRFVTEEPTDKYYEDKPFMIPGARGGPHTGEKRYRPQRAASSKALQTVHKALNSDDEDSDTDEEDLVPAKKKPKDSTESPFKTQSHHNLLLQEMIELKRQREKKLAASALHNHGIITRGPERIRVPNPQGGVMIIPRNEMNATGVLRMAATREIKRRVTMQPQLPNLTPAGGRFGRPVVNNNSNQTVVKADLSKKDPGLSIIDQTTPGSNQPKTIRIVASNANGQPSVKQTAENVRVSADGYLIISGKNSGIKVTENTKIVIQPPGASQTSSESASLSQSSGKEVLIKKIPTPSTFKQMPGLSLSGMTSTQGSVVTGSPSATIQKPSQVPAQGVSASPVSQVQTQQQINLQGLLKQTASNPQLCQQQALQGLVNQMGNKADLSSEMKKKLDIAQRILLLNQQKKKLLEQQKLVQQQQQANGSASGVHPPKIIKLDSSSGSGNSSAIEDRLRDPSLNIDRQLGSVSQNVISNVNIASDILDTYYSVLNDAKSSAGNQSVSSAVVTMSHNTQPLTQTMSITPSVNTEVSLPQTPVQVVTGQTTLSANAPVTQNVKPAPAQGNISEVTRQIYDLISKTGTGGLVPALAKAQLMKQNVTTPVLQDGPEVLIGSPRVQILTTPSQNVAIANIPCQNDAVSNIVNQTPQVVNQIPQAVKQVPQVVNQVPQVVNQVPQVVPTLTSNSSISDLLRSAMLKRNTEASSDVSPIEALLTSNTPVQKETVTVSNTVQKSPLVQALTVRAPVALKSVPQKLEPSPERNERQNLFDSFETSSCSAVPSVVVNDRNLTGQIENTDVTKEIKLKLRADGISLPASSTLNFGSPLKTSSVLEALKCKLHTVKPHTQSSETPNSAGSDVENVCICSELAFRIPPPTAASDIVCELHPHCTCIHSSDINPACTPSSSSSIESPNCPVKLPYSEVYSPNCRLESVLTVQSEKIPQNKSTEEIKMKNSEVDDMSKENDEILIAVPLKEFLKTATIEESTQVQNESISENLCDDCEKQNENRKKAQKIRIKIAIENNGQVNLKNVSVEKSDDIIDDMDKCNGFGGFISSENEVGNEVKQGLVHIGENCVKYAKQDLLSKQLEGKQANNKWNCNMNEPVNADKNNNTELTRVGESPDNMPFSVTAHLEEYGTKNSMQNSYVEKEKAIEYVVKRVQSDARTLESIDGVFTTEVLTLVPVPQIPSPIFISSKACKNWEYNSKQDAGKDRESLRKKCYPKGKNIKQFSKEKLRNKTNEERFVLPRPFQRNSVYPLGLYSPNLDKNYQRENNEKCEIQKEKRLHSVSFYGPFVQRSKKKIKEEELCETNLNNVRVKRKIIRLSSEPVKMYRVCGSSLRKPDQTFKEKDPTTNIESVYPNGTLSKHKLDRNKTELVMNRVDFSQKGTSILGPIEIFKDKKDIFLASCRDSQNISNREDSLDPPENLFFKSEMDIVSDMPLSDIDVNKMCDEDFFSTELFNPIYPSNPFCGDGSDKDPELEKIENDIFELQDKYSTAESNISLLPDQITLPAVSGNTQNSTVVFGFSPNIHSTQPEGLNVSLSSSNQATVPTGIMGRMVSLDSGNNLLSDLGMPSSVNLIQNTSQGVGTPLVLSKGNIQSPMTTVQISTNFIQDNVQQAVLPTVLQQQSGNVNIQPTFTNIQLPTNGQQPVLPNMVSQQIGNLPNVSTVQGNFRPVPALSAPVQVPALSAPVQVPALSAPVQIPSALLQALKQTSDGLPTNQTTTQSVLLQQLNTLIGNRQCSLQVGTPNTNVVNNIEQVNPLNVIQNVSQPVISVSAPSALQSNLQKVHVQNIPQLPEVTFGNIGNVQSVNPEHIKMDVIDENQSMDVTSTHSMTNTGVVHDTEGLCNHFTEASGANTLNNFITSNLNTVNQTSILIGGNSAQSNPQQSGFYVTGTDGGMMDTSADANTSLTETTENQSQQNQIS